MKKNNMNEPTIMKDYPISGDIEGWYFKIDEVSAGVYVVEGRDLAGRTISRTGTDPDKELKSCVDEVKQMKKL